MKRQRSNIDEEENRLCLASILTKLSKFLFNKPEDLVPKLKIDVDVHFDGDLTPVWFDEDEENDTKKNNKNTAHYSTTLKHKFNTLMGTPNWAKLNKKSKKESDDEDEEQILQTVGHLQTVKPNNLKKDLLEFKKLPKLNSLNLNQEPKKPMELITEAIKCFTEYKIMPSEHNN
ncbi:hypothetical protein EVAR_35417_1 [Eumeta japonica]|uniref:Uncharacterized protein n=1 Tax=Eumeta variegata TaxID=151549 RepID=A0A4C1X6Q6_EUMVA|nr:hypothetical protein EVAR_35417_1 [Eumeta japonica]